MTKMEEIKRQSPLQMRQRLAALHQGVPRDPEDHWLYEYEGELHAPWEWLDICERAAGDEVALDRLGRARIHLIEDEPNPAFG